MANGDEIDVTIGGVDFRLATADDLPETVETVPIRREQFDAESEPGEVSLQTTWWRRSRRLCELSDGPPACRSHSRSSRSSQDANAQSKPSSSWYHDQNFSSVAPTEIASGYAPG